MEKQVTNNALFLRRDSWIWAETALAVSFRDKKLILACTKMGLVIITHHQKEKGNNKFKGNLQKVIAIYL